MRLISYRKAKGSKPVKLFNKKWVPTCLYLMIKGAKCNNTGENIAY